MDVLLTFRKVEYIMQLLVLELSYILTGHFDPTISFFSADHKAANKSHNEQNILLNLKWTQDNSKECPRRYFYHNDMDNGGQLVVQ